MRIVKILMATSMSLAFAHAAAAADVSYVLETPGVT